MNVKTNLESLPFCLNFYQLYIARKQIRRKRQLPGRTRSNTAAACPPTLGHEIRERQCHRGSPRLRRPAHRRPRSAYLRARSLRQGLHEEMWRQSGRLHSDGTAAGLLPGRRPIQPDVWGEHDAAFQGGTDWDGQAVYHRVCSLGQGNAGRQVWDWGEDQVVEDGVPKASGMNASNIHEKIWDDVLNSIFFALGLWRKKTASYCCWISIKGKIKIYKKSTCLKAVWKLLKCSIQLSKILLEKTVKRMVHNFQQFQEKLLYFKPFKSNFECSQISQMQKKTEFKYE